MSAPSFAERCAAAVAAVPHLRGCRLVVRSFPDPVLPSDHGWTDHCTCDRDARIGKGLATLHKLAYESSGHSEDTWLAAFAEAAR